MHYYPFGIILDGICTKAAGSLNNRFLYNSKERQSSEFADRSGMEVYDFNTRMYESQLGRWWQIDAKSDSMRRFSPYCHAFNNPIRFIDPDGKKPSDIVVLKSSTGAEGFGHLAVLIGNDKTGWTFVSKEGRDTKPWYSNPVTGGPSIKLEMHFNTLDEFKKTQKTDVALKGYTNSVQFSTTEAEDNAALSATKKSAGSWYQFSASSCADAVSDGLKAAKLDPGESNIPGSEAKTATPLKGLDIRPYVRFDAIKENNKERIVKK